MTVPNSTASTADFEFAALFEANNYRSAIVGEFSPYLGTRVLEVGAGIGQILEEIARIPGIEKILAVEPDPRFHPNHEGRPWELLAATSRDVDPAGEWTSVLLVNVLEHIKEDREELVWLRSLLAPQRGYLCLLVPARPELYSPIDKDFGHYRRYTKRDLEAKLTEAGFEIVRCCYYNWAGYFAWALSMKLLRSRSFSVPAVRLFDRAIFPWVHWGETHLFRPPLGQSLLAVARAIRIP